MFVRHISLVLLLASSSVVLGMQKSPFNFPYKSPAEYALTKAIYDRDLPKIKTLAKTANLAQNGHASPALHQATVYEQQDTVEILLAAGAPADCTNYLGETALFKAARNGNIAIATLLLKARAHINHVTEHGLTPLECALKGLPGMEATKQVAMIAFLLKLGANVSQETKQPIVPCGNHRAIQLLLQHLNITSIQVQSDT